MLPFLKDLALRKCLVDIFSDRARWRDGISKKVHDTLL